MKAATLCSGIGAAEVAMPHWQWVLQSEIEAAPRSVLKARHGAQDARHRRAVGPALWGDFTTIRARHFRRLGIEMPEWIVAGTPCQAFSLAGLRKSMNDARGNLTLEFVRLVHSLRRAGSLRGIVWENVPGVLSTADNAFGCFLGALVGNDAPIPQPFGGSWPDAGMVAGAWARVAWRVLDAQHFGVPQRRRRVILVADFGGWCDPVEILFERLGLYGHSSSGGRTAQGDTVAPTLQAGGNSTGGTRPPGSSADTASSLIVGAIAAHSFTGGMGGRPEGAAVGHLVMAHGQGGAEVAEVAEDKSPTLTCNHEAPICFTAQDHGADAMSDLSPTLRAGNHTGSHQNRGVMPALTVETGVRRLMPIECERLQGFPDDFTLVPHKGKPMADGPRYKMCGNSKAVPCIRWVLQRLEASAMGERKGNTCA